MALLCAAGIDVGKTHLDLALAPSERCLRVINDPGGATRIVGQLKHNAARRVIVETTGDHALGLLRRLRREGFEIGMVEPRRIKAFRTAEGGRAKNDRLDARLNAPFALTVSDAPNPAPAAESDEFRALSTRRSQLVALVATEETRLKQSPDKAVSRSCRATIALLEAERDRVADELQDGLLEPRPRDVDEIRTGIPGSQTASLATPAEQPAPVPSGKSLDELMQDYLAERGTSDVKRRHNFLAPLRALTDSMGGPKDITHIEKNDLVRLKDILLKTPASWATIFPGHTLQEAVKANKQFGLRTLKSKTISVAYLGSLRGFFEWAVTNGKIDRNPMDGVKVAIVRRADARLRMPFSSDNLRTIFRAPLFQGCESRRRLAIPGECKLDDHRRWAPLLALYTGARANELGRLLLSDVCEHKGVMCLAITETVGDVLHEPKRFKSKAAHRLIPIHADLVDLGFLEYVNRTRLRDTHRLFPMWNKCCDGYYSSTFSKAFGRFLDSVGINDKRLVFHSFRHSFKDACRYAGIEEPIQDALMGHEPRSIGSVYGLGYSVERLKEAIDKLAYPEVRRLLL